MKLPDHPSRLQLHEEVHARPPVALWPNERMLSQAFLLDAAARQTQIEWLDACVKALGVGDEIAPDHVFRVLTLAEAPRRILLKWELHGEFATIAFIVQSKVDLAVPFLRSRAELESELNNLLIALKCPPIRESGGQRLAAVDLVFDHHALFEDAQEVSQAFNGNTLLGSFILPNKQAQLWTDLRLDEDGYINYYIPHDLLGSRQVGRIARALAEAETYRMTAMLAYPVAKSLSAPLRTAETELADLSEKISQLQLTSGVHIEKDGESLKQLSGIASRIEQWISSYGLRFTASEAYRELLTKNLSELSEDAMPGVQTLSEFMDRRFQPAMNTCVWTQRRLKELSDRISRTTQTLRTRIEFVNEEQTQNLLVSMDQRAKLQLRLQETVEGLSILVLTYYAVNLLMVVAKGGKEVGLTIYPEIIAAVAAPLIALCFFIISRLRRQAASKST